jgi:phosphoribosyl 1,2-cyclic phosphodiesterase
MKVIIWGARGSIPLSGPDTKHFGGNTACIQVSEEDWLLVLDAGSGMHRMKVSKERQNKRVDILLTHLHLDHIQGLGFFEPLFNPSMEVHIWGPASSTHSLQERLRRYLSPPLFPVRLRDLPCNLQLHEIENSFFEIGPFSIHSRYVIHAGPTVGFRVKGSHSVLSYIPDHEPALGRVGLLRDIKWISGIDIALDADVLIHDGQYNCEEYKHKVGWGHSSMEDAALFASLGHVKELVFFHHDPSHTDICLNEMFAEFKKKNTYLFKQAMATEGMEINLK